ncbi:MAG TPA: PEP-CTERM sorting domain-containing protein [Methyloversatilis sp.]
MQKQWPVSMECFLLTVGTSCRHGVFPMKSFVLAAIFGVSFVIATPSQAADASHVYLLSGSLADQSGGPSLAPIGDGTLMADGYAFDQGEGLSLAGVLIGDSYTIDLSFSFDAVGGYRRILQFKDYTSDRGLYVLGGALNFYNFVTGSPDSFAVGRPVQVTITRSAAGEFSGYVDGAEKIAFTDSGNDAVFSGPDSVAQFFVDDHAVGGEMSGGKVSYIRTWNRALSAAEVAALAAPVPEPGTWVMMMAGIALLGAVARRR